MRSWCSPVCGSDKCKNGQRDEIGKIHVSISWQQLSFGPCRPRNPFILLLIFLKTRIRCLIKFLNWKKKKPCLECLSPLRVESGNYPLSHSPPSVKEGTTVRALAKRNK